MDEEKSYIRPSRERARKRRANHRGGRTIRHEVWCSVEEEGALASRAAREGMTIPRLLVESALASDSGETASERRELREHLLRLRYLLGANANNINQIAYQANAADDPGGTLRELREELLEAVAQAQDLAWKINDVLDELRQ